MAGWNYERNNTLQIKMEDLTHDPFQGFLTVFDHFGFLDESVVSFPMRILRAQLPFHNRIATKLRCRGVCIRKGCITAEALLGILYRNSFKVLAGGRSPGQTNEKSHYRKGVAGDWRNYFGPKHIDVFKERFGDLLIQLGYETDTSWS